MIKFPWRRNRVYLFADGPRRLTFFEDLNYAGNGGDWRWIPWP
jgi:hypothetical protein